MRTLGGIAIALLAVAVLGAQSRGGFVNTGGMSRNFGAAHVGGGGSSAVNLGLRPGGGQFLGGGMGRHNLPGYRYGGLVYAYPVFLGGYGGYGGGDRGGDGGDGGGFDCGAYGV